MDRSLEAAILAFDAMEILVSLVLFLPLFAANRKHVSLDANVHVLGIHAGKLGLDDEFIFRLGHIDSRPHAEASRPILHHRRWPPAFAKESLEEIVHFVAQS